ncbi:MAG TPA: hypothetical protein DDY39_18430 [Nitrospira sp.]|nr:hypothetical protein [Nitrospira sp.]
MRICLTFELSCLLDGGFEMGDSIFPLSYRITERLLKEKESMGVVKQPNDDGNRAAARDNDFKTRMIGGSGSPRC